MKKSLIELHIAVLLFSVAGLFGKFIHESAMVIVFGRSIFAAMAIFTIISYRKINISVNCSRSFIRLLLSGLVLAIHWVLFFHAIKISSVAIGLIGYSAFPIFVTFLEPITTKKKLRTIDIFSAATVTIGLILVAPSFQLNDTGFQGLLWAILSGALYAILAILNKSLVKVTSYLHISLYQHGSAALFILPFIIMSKQDISTDSYLLFLILGVLCTALPQTLFIKSLIKIKAQLASIVAGLEPVYGILLAFIFLDEIPNLQTILGGAIVLCAIIIATKYQQNK
ncbi:MAG: DMT family transporter [Desulfotalea sp.]